MAKIITHKNSTKKQVITAKAASLFRKKGFAAASMRELAETIGVEASSLYNHIGSKNELLQTICFSIANDFTHHLQQIENTKSNVVSKIHQIISFHIKMMFNRFDEVFVANHEWKQLQEPFLSNFLHQRKAYEIRLIELVKLGIKNKEIKNIQPSIAVLTILSAVRGLEFWHHHQKEADRADLEADMVNHLLYGLIKQ